MNNETLSDLEISDDKLSKILIEIMKVERQYIAEKRGANSERIDNVAKIINEEEKVQ